MVFVVLAGLFEVIMALCLKESHGFSRLWPSVGFAVFAALSFGLLSYGLKSLDVGSAYAIWTGIGAVGTATVGVLVMGDELSLMKAASMLLILGGVIGLNLAGGH